MLVEFRKRVDALRRTPGVREGGSCGIDNLRQIFPKQGEDGETPGAEQ